MPRIALPVPPDIPNAAAEGRLLLFPDRRKPTTPTQRRVRAGLEGPATYETGIGRQRLQGQRQREREGDKRQRESDRGNAFLPHSYSPLPLFRVSESPPRPPSLRCGSCAATTVPLRNFFYKIGQHLESVLAGSEGIAAYFYVARCSTPYNTPTLYASRVQAVCRAAHWAVN